MISKYSKSSISNDTNSINPSRAELGAEKQILYLQRSFNIITITSHDITFRGNFQVQYLIPLGYTVSLDLVKVV